MTRERLKWIGKAIEYELMTNKEFNFLFETVQTFADNYFINKTTEEDLEKLFAEVQWREKSVAQGAEDEKMEDRSRTSKWNESNRCREV